MEMIRALEENLGIEAKLEFYPTQPGDVPQTWAEVEKAGRLLNHRPTASFVSNLRYFAVWLRESVPKANLS